MKLSTGGHQEVRGSNPAVGRSVGRQTLHLSGAVVVLARDAHLWKTCKSTRVGEPSVSPAAAEAGTRRNLRERYRPIGSL